MTISKSRLEVEVVQEETNYMGRAPKKGNRFSKFIVILVIILNVIFTAAVLYIYFKVGSEPGVLIGTWFTFTTVELWALAGIKKQEQKGE